MQALIPEYRAALQQLRGQLDETRAQLDEAQTDNRKLEQQVRRQTKDCTVGPVDKVAHVCGAGKCRAGAPTLLQQRLLVLHQHQGFAVEGCSVEASPCTALQASLWKQLAQDKDVAAQIGARAAPPSRRQVTPTAADPRCSCLFPYVYLAGGLSSKLLGEVVACKRQQTCWTTCKIPHASTCWHSRPPVQALSVESDIARAALHPQSMSACCCCRTGGLGFGIPTPHLVATTATARGVHVPCPTAVLVHEAAAAQS